MKNVFLLSLCMMLMIAGCSTIIPSHEHMTDTTVSDVTLFSGADTSSGTLTQTGVSIDDMKIANTLSEETQQALRSLYKNDKITFFNSYQLGDFIITNYDDGLNQIGSQIMMVVGKLNNQRIKLYEGNSGEISCSIVEKFGFPQELLQARYYNQYGDNRGASCPYGPNDYTGSKADYTIPQESLPFAIK